MELIEETRFSKIWWISKPTEDNIGLQCKIFKDDDELAIIVPVSKDRRGGEARGISFSFQEFDKIVKLVESQRKKVREKKEPPEEES